MVSRAHKLLGFMDSSSLSWEITGKRWLRSGLFTAAATFTLWFVWELALPRSAAASLLTSALRFLLFHLAQLIFILAQRLVLQPELPAPVSVADTLLALLALARAAVGLRLDPDVAYLVLHRIKVLRDRLALLLATLASGFLALFALTLPLARGALVFDMGVRGAGLGLCYAAFYTWGKGHLLRFPIIQRPVYFSMKLGLASALSSAIRIAVISLPVSEILVHSFHHFLVGDRGTFSILHQLIFLIAAFFVALIWNLCCHFVQVIHTRRYVFAPPAGSAAAEMNPTEPLLSVLENEEDLLRLYLGFLDLFIVSGVSEINAESWRRAALFEESGDAYKKVISLCLRPLDTLTLKLVRGLEGMPGVGHHKADSKAHVDFSTSPKESFQEFQLCLWCASITSSLTSFSRTEDRYGVAQLTGSNGAVLSSLISCLLILEVYLGRRSTFGALSFVGPNGIQWAVPFRGALMDMDRKQTSTSNSSSGLFKKKSLEHKKAHVLVDVLRTSIHRIVSVFRDEMQVVAASGSLSSVTERDWLGKQKPVFGTPEMHLQKLSQFIDFQE